MAITILPAYAQTRVGEVNLSGEFSCIPGEFMLSGNSQLLMADLDEEDYTDSVVFLNTDFLPVKTIYISNSDVQSAYVFEYLDFDDYKGVELECLMLVTQSLFNNDEKYEYIVRNGTGRWNKNIFSIVQEDGNVIFTSNQETDSNGNTMRICNIYLTKYNGNYHLLVSYDFRDQDGEKHILYSIDHQTQSIQRVAELPFNVFPTIADRSQEIIIELGEDNNASEISVIDANGRVINAIPVQPGQRVIRVPASKMGRGLNLLNARSNRGQATRKIVVK